MLILLASLAIAWVAVMVAVTAVCVSAARGDRALHSAVRAAWPERATGPVRLSA